MNIPQSQSPDPLIPNQTLVGSPPPPPPPPPLPPLSPSFMQNVSKMTIGVGKGIYSFASGTKSVTGGTLTCVREYFDSSSGTKDPSSSILNSCKRLAKHDSELSDLLEFLSDKAESYYRDNADSLGMLLSQAIKEYPKNSQEDNKETGNKSPILKAKSLLFHQIGDLASWIMSMGEDVIAKTVKANILHIAANLADASFDPGHDFRDGKNNPIGRLLSVIIKCFEDFQGPLDQILLLPDLNRPQAYQKLFQELSDRLLKTCFPSGAEDMQLFSSTIPVMKVAKGYIWNKIAEALPLLLEKFYHQTRPVSEQYPDWKDQFDEEAYGLQADQLVNLPSVLFQFYIRDKRACVLDDFQPLLENFLQKNGCQPLQAAYLSQLMLKYGKDLTLSDDPSLLACVAFAERYFMERILFNLSNFVPGDVDEPLPTHMLSKWMQGNVFKMLFSTLSGEKLDPLEKIAAVRDLLAPFGLDQKGTFPLPEEILSKKWPDIEKFIDEKLPGIIFDKIPSWYALGSKESNKRKIILWLDDSSIVKTISNLSGMAVDRGIGLLAKSQQSMSMWLNNQLPSPVLSKDSQDKLDEQLKELLDDDPSNNNQTLTILKEFGINCIEAFALQVFEKLYENYDSSLVSENLAQLFETEEDDDIVEILNPSDQDPSEEIFGENILKEDVFEDLALPPGIAARTSSSSFPAWLARELTKACRKLTDGNGSGDDLKDLEQAIHLKNAIRLGKDPLLVNKAQDELNILWPKIQPKFKTLSRDLLGIIGCDGAASLPMPQNFQPLIWKMLNDALPSLLFNQAGDLLLPLLEKQDLKAQIGKLPNGDLICRGCEELARDIVKHIPEWVEGEIDTLAQKVQTHLPEVDLSKKAQKEMEEALRSILKGDDPAYEDVWGDLQAYLEGVLLKAAQAAGNINGSDWVKIQNLTQTTWGGLKAGSDPSASLKTIDPKETLIDFTDKFLAILGIEAPSHLFGIPQALQGPLLSVLKEKMAFHLLKLHDWEGKIRKWNVRPNPLENILPASLIAKGISSEIFYQLEKGTDKLAKSGNSIPKIYSALSDNLTDLAKKDYKIAGIFQEMIAKAIPNPALSALFDLLNDPSADGGKLEIADWITPLLTDKIIGCLTPIMEKEKNGGAEFDQKLLMAALPLVTHHLKHINQALSSPRGLSLFSYTQAAGIDLHPAFISGIGQGTASHDFFNEQMDLIFQAVFPNGLDDLRELLPEFFTDEQLKSIEKSAKSIAVEKLPLVLVELFDRENLVDLFNELLKDAVNTLESPIAIKRKPQTPVPPLTQDEKKRQDEMDQMAGELFLEAARLLELPLGFFKKSIAASMGAAMREKFNGEFLSEILQKAFAKMSSKKFIKLDGNKKAPVVPLAEKKLKELEWKLAEKSIGFAFRSLAASIDGATDVFTNPVLKFLRKSIFAVCSFVFFKIVGTLLRIFQVKRLAAIFLHSLIHYRAEKILKVFVHGDMHQNALYQGIDALKGVFNEDIVVI